MGIKFVRIVFKVCVIVEPMSLQDSGTIGLGTSTSGDRWNTYATRTVLFSLMIPGLASPSYGYRLGMIITVID
jgi:hypothetical protein